MKSTLLSKDSIEVKSLEFCEELLMKIIGIEDESIRDERLCLKSTKEEIKKCLLSGCSYGLYDKNELVAFSLCYYSDYCTGYIDKCFVSPEYRGNGIQKLLLKNNISSLLERGVDEIYAMASPINIPSLKSFESVGFYVKKELEFYGNYRYLLKRDESRD